MRLEITRGTMADYRALAALHYRAGEPAVVDGVLRVRHRGELVGVLVVARGVLNGPWRHRVWPGRFDRGTLVERARAVNHLRLGVRCIARVIVDPRVRGMGVGRALVRAYLRRPHTRYTEALAAMARATPMFVQAGMRSMEPAPPTTRTRRLAAALRKLRIGPARLACPALLWRGLDTARRRELARAVLAWARASKSTCRHVHGGGKRVVMDLAAVAAGSLLAGACPGGAGVFVHEQRGGRSWRKSAVKKGPAARNRKKSSARRRRG